MMAMPSMNAEFSVYPSSRSYRSTGAAGGQVAGSVAPQATFCTPCLLGHQVCVSCSFRIGWPPIQCDTPTIQSC
jgi:hypothetical protein